MGRLFRNDGDYDGRTKSGKLGKKIRWIITAIFFIILLIVVMVG